MLPLHEFTTPLTTYYAQLGTVSSALQSVWICLHDAGQPVAELAQQLAPLDTPERLLILPQGLARCAPPAGADEAPTAAWLPEPDLPRYLDALSARVLAQCPPDVSVTVLGSGQGAAAACYWLSHSQPGYERLILLAAVFPPAFDRHAMFAQLPPRPVTVVGTTVDTLTPEAAAEGLVQDLQAAGLPVTLRLVPPGHLPLAALGPSADAADSAPAAW